MNESLIKRVQKDINQYKEILTEQAKTKGITENFGQKYVRKLKDKYKPDRLVDYTARTTITMLIYSFETWCMTFEV